MFISLIDYTLIGSISNKTKGSYLPTTFKLCLSVRNIDMVVKVIMALYRVLRFGKKILYLKICTKGRGWETFLKHKKMLNVYFLGVIKSFNFNKVRNL